MPLENNCEDLSRSNQDYLNKFESQKNIIIFKTKQSLCTMKTLLKFIKRLIIFQCLYI